MQGFDFTSTTLEPERLRSALEDPAAGGYASFEGWVRNHNEGHAVTRLEYEAFELLARKEGERIVAEAIARFDVLKATCVHRVGSLAIGELAVWVGVSARHRAEAFAACRYIIDEVKHRVPIWKKEHYVTGDSGWVNCERCAAHAHEHEHEHHDHRHDHSHGHAPSPQPSPATGRGSYALQPPPASGKGSAAPQASLPSGNLIPDYSRQIALAEVGPQGQARLRAARVLVIGAGGLGVPVLSYLAGAGIGTVGIVDDDVVQPSNLHRQPLYALSESGQSKAALAAQRLHALNPEVLLRVHPERFTNDNAARLLEHYDLAIDCSDNFATKFALNDALVRTRKPGVFASIYQYEGQLQVYAPASGSACLRCLWPEATRDGIVGNCAEAGVLGPVPGVLGSLQALEAIKLIVGLDSPLRTAMLLVDLRTLGTRTVNTRRAADCLETHGALPDAVDVSANLELADLAQAHALGCQLIDIRETEEVAALPSPVRAVRNLPLSQLIANPLLLQRSECYALICARGSRSRGLAMQLRSNGFHEVYSVQGGIAALTVEHAH